MLRNGVLGQTKKVSALTIAIAISEIAAIWVAWRIMRSADPLVLRVLNSLLAFIPFVGPLAAYWIANFPEPHHPALRDNQRYSADVFSRWIAVLSMTDLEKKKSRWREVIETHEKDDH